MRKAWWLATGEEGERSLLSPQTLGRVNWMWGEAVDSQSLPHPPDPMICFFQQGCTSPPPPTAPLTGGLGDQVFKYLSLCGTFSFKPPPHRGSIKTLLLSLVWGAGARGNPHLLVEIGDNLQELAISFHHGSGDWIQVIRQV